MRNPILLLLGLLLLPLVPAGCNDENGTSPSILPVSDSAFQARLGRDSSQLASLRDSLTRIDRPDSLKAAWKLTLDSLASELEDIRRDFGNSATGTADSRLTDREAALIRRLDALGQALGQPVNPELRLPDPPVGTYWGKPVGVDGKAVGVLAIRKHEGTSSTTEWPPAEIGGSTPDTLSVRADDKLTLFMRNLLIQDWEISVFSAEAIPMLDTAPLATWEWKHTDQVVLSSQEFDSLASNKADGVLAFNLRITIPHLFVNPEVVLITHLTYDKTSQTFQSRDSLFLEYSMHTSAHAKLEYQSQGDSLRTFLYIPGSPYFVQADTSTFKLFPIPYGSFEFRMLALPAACGPGVTCRGWVYEMLSDTPQKTDNYKTFYPVRESNFLDWRAEE